jgi:hypothetical protein
MHFNEAYDPFRALRSAWRIVKKAPAAMLLGSVLLAVCDGGLAVLKLKGDDTVHVQIADFDFQDTERWKELARQVAQLWLSGWAVGFALFALLFSIASFLFGSLVRVGFARAVERGLAEEEDEIGDLFEARGRWGSMVLVRVLRWLVFVLASTPGIALSGIAGFATYGVTEQEWAATSAAVIAFLVYLPVWIYVGLGLQLAPMAVAVEGMGPAEAVSRSWQLVRGHRWTLLLYWIVLWVAQILIVLPCCCCPLLVFVPTLLEETTTCDSYLRLVKSGSPETWWAKPKPVGADEA